MAAEPNDKLKSVDMIERRRFLLGLAAAAFTPPLLGANNKSTSPPLLERALVLSGGGARGAYEAGIVGALAAADGVSDGMPLPGYGLVAGTSIGALNGWFVATGQYQRMRELW
jgi:predicted acylesterase/phospholipase RssA